MKKKHPVPHDLLRHYFNRINSIWRWKKSNLSGALKHRLAELFNLNCTPLQIILSFWFFSSVFRSKPRSSKTIGRKITRKNVRNRKNEMCNFLFACAFVCVNVRVKVYIWIWHCLNIRGTSMHAIDTYMRLKSRVRNEKLRFFFQL